MSEVISFKSTPCIVKELDAITELGLYKDKDDFILDAINTLLSARRELRIEIACRLYEKEEISLGKAAEIVGTSIEEMKKLLSAWDKTQDRDFNCKNKKPYKSRA